MNLSFLGIGNSGQNQTEQIKTPVSEETAPKQLPASSANLKSGQVISGEVFAMDGRDIQLKAGTTAAHVCWTASFL